MIVMDHSNATKPRFESVTPRLPVADMEAALSYYCDELGFQIGWKWGNPLTHANVYRDAISLDLIATPSERSPALAYIQLSGVDAYLRELEGRKVEVGNLGDRPYGMRDFEIVDPSGNRLAFGEPITK
jgi:catechol 2,3-dioxygenase-like lactoylglutathione lyase family enzyme